MPKYQVKHRAYTIEITAPNEEGGERFWTWCVSTEDGFLAMGDSASAEQAVKDCLHDLKGMNEL